MPAAMSGWSTARRSSGLARAWTRQDRSLPRRRPAHAAVPTRSAERHVLPHQAREQDRRVPGRDVARAGEGDLRRIRQPSDERSAVPLVGDHRSRRPHTTRTGHGSSLGGLEAVAAPRPQQRGHHPAVVGVRRMPQASRSATRSPRSMSPRRTARRTSGLTIAAETGDAAGGIAVDHVRGAQQRVDPALVGPVAPRAGR